MISKLNAATSGLTSSATRRKFGIRLTNKHAHIYIFPPEARLRGHFCFLSKKTNLPRRPCLFFSPLPASEPCRQSFLAKKSLCCIAISAFSVKNALDALQFLLPDEKTRCPRRELGIFFKKSTICSVDSAFSGKYAQFPPGIRLPGEKKHRPRREFSFFWKIRTVPAGFCAS